MTVIDSSQEVFSCRAFPGDPKDLRADERKPSLSPDEALANVPDRKYHFIAVKKIME